MSSIEIHHSESKGKNGLAYVIDAERCVFAATGAAYPHFAPLSDVVLLGKMTAPMDATTAFRTAICLAARDAYAALPRHAIRIDKAINIALTGDVVLHEDGSASVVSCADPGLRYHIVGTKCTCPDAKRTGVVACKHRLARRLYMRAVTVSKTLLEEALDMPETHLTPTQEQSTTGTKIVADLTVIVNGTSIVLTLEDTSDERLMARIEVLSKKYGAKASKPGKSIGK
jgi:hypothetical protein